MNATVSEGNVIPEVTLSAVPSEDGNLIKYANARIGTNLHGKYRIDTVLGIGGMGVVYAATHRNGKRFAVKLLHPEYSSRRDLRIRFLREGYVANAVSHPGVVSVLDDDVAEDGAAFLVMELLDGNTVEALGARPGSRMPIREALGIAYQLLDVLDAAHAKTIIHRDIKPANVFVLRDGQVKVLDFGLARLRDAATSLEATRTGEQMGTPAFMAPEQARGDVKSIDRRTDIWAVGATLFTAMSGRLVYEGANARQLMVRAATTPARSLSSLMPNLPSSVSELVAKAIAFDMDARWPTAGAMRDVVRAAHEELYGEPLREHLLLLFDSDQRVDECGATEPSPGTNSVPMLHDSAVVSASSANGSALDSTTIARSVSPADAKRTIKRRSLYAVGASAALSVCVVLVLLQNRSSELARMAAPLTGAIAPRLPAEGNSRDPGDKLKTTTMPALPNPATRAVVSLSSAPMPSSALGQRVARRLPNRSATTAAPEGSPHQPVPSVGLASSVQDKDALVNHLASANAGNPPENSKKHRRIDDAIDHQ